MFADDVNRFDDLNGHADEWVCSRCNGRGTAQQPTVEPPPSEAKQ